jgi:RNA polymerase sigma factor for flagellar operon FliA
VNSGTSQTSDPAPAALASLGPAGAGTGALRARISEAYALHSREGQEEQWILDHLRLVRHVVGKVTGAAGFRGDVDDLISAGTLGLVKAAKAFDPARQLEFKTYAYIRIRGAVLDELRGRCFVPVGVRQRVREIRKAFQDLAAETGSPPDDEALAERAGMTLQVLLRTLEEARKQNFLSIHGLEDDDSAMESLVPADTAPQPHSQAEGNEQLTRLADAIRQLPQRDRVVLVLYYERDLTMKEIAQVLGITESRVSQVHASALFKLSMKLGKTT